MSENTFFVSDALTGRLTEKILAEQSDEDVADDYQAAPSGLVECTVFFKKGNRISYVCWGGGSVLCK